MKTNLPLVIGGTGMLAEVVRELSSIYGVVGVWDELKINSTLYQNFLRIYFR